ncbi:hypothetical protein EJ02DRAFT_406998 [Clathrospora elynae]|uniref:Uncharacterized protein n=1 Tax=Clathrospora elynae TaxID=706981 RepID=A0A6A5SKM0_9PLEO|nr:hypothetical protein EJ02DRAFT_406998 [Clathrospora elynae]
MQASKPTIRALRALVTGPRLTGPRLTVRHLSMTGSTTFSSLLTTDKPYASTRSRPVRLSGETTIPVPEATETGDKVRHFNTSRSRKAAGDTSTIDFMFIPDFDPELKRTSSGLRVPILPWIEAGENVKGRATEAEEPVMVPTISTVAADGTHIHAPSAMSDMTDSNQFDYQGMAETVANKITQTSEAGEGMVRQILTGLMDDVLGPKRGSTRA